MYPSAVQKDSALICRDDRAYEFALKQGKSISIIDFLRKYPNTHLKEKAELEKNKLFFTEQTDGTVDGYIRFCKKNEKSIYFDMAMDSIETISFLERNYTGIKYLLANPKQVKDFSGLQDKLFDLLLFDGHPNTLNYVNKEYGYYLDKFHKSKLDQITEEASKTKDLFFKIGVSDYNRSEYEQFINKMAPKDIAWVALQRLIEQDVKIKDWNNVKSTLMQYEPLFNYKGENQVTNLLKTIDDKDRVVNIEKLKAINTPMDEYAPVPSIDNKKLYFCGKNRRDNFGGEDIFESFNKSNNFTNTRPVGSLSTAYGNEAPLSISADGNTMVLWTNENGGDILTSYYQKDGTWSEPESMGEPLNTIYYEGDAMLSADGKTIIFVSSRPGGMNLYTENNMSYYGDDNYPTDIYVCNRMEDGSWSAPINLGPEINTAYSERSPYLHPDGKTIYFSSEGHAGFGRLDVYKSEKLTSEGSVHSNEDDWRYWSKCKNLGKEINGSSNDWGFKFSTDGKNVYYAAKDQTAQKSSLVLLLDISGSMGGSKMIAMQKAATEVCLNALENNTEVAVLAFEGDCYQPVREYSTFSIDPKELTDFIENLRVAGGTPMYEALQVAGEYLKNYSSYDSKFKSVILMSDGDASGCIKIDQMFSYLKKINFKHKVYTIALEVNEYSMAYSDLVLIAKRTGGEFFHAESADDLGSAFAQATNKIFNFSLKSSNSDIFRFTLPEDLRPQVVSTISGTILDANKKPLSAKVYWEDLSTGENMGVSTSSPVDGSYFIVLPVGKNYGYFADHPDYFPSSNNVDLRNQKTMEEIQVNIDVVSYKDMIENQRTVKINNIFFETSKFDLKSESYVELDRLAMILKRYPDIKIEIHGHTDNVGDESYNLQLSEKRAQAVLNYLVIKGVDSSIIAVKGFGYSKPLVDNSSDANKAKNRRVELKFVKN